ncbi:MFS transporter [Novosphingobium olei]|uniref:MFS transporter n=1 Tax=Novosphingobium olei TaxID=2728851 RepID=UPI0030936512|nr:MFS transporter [Novosphingobium olei]
MSGARHRETRFLSLYALAWAGSTIAYVPFLTLLLPMQVEALAGGQAVRWLALTTFLGAVVASVANVAFGWISDLAGRRRPFVLAGLTLSSVMLQAAPHASTLAGLIAVIALWQAGLNLMIGPLAAWAGDQVPDRRKGMLGGLLAFAPASGALAGALGTWGGGLGGGLGGGHGSERMFALVGAIVIACVLPIVVLGKDGGADHDEAVSAGSEVARKVIRGMATRMWVARLLVQISEASLFAFFYLWLRSVDPGLGGGAIARILLAAMVIGAVVALFAGRRSDRTGRPVTPLMFGALGAAVGLAIMALSSSRDGAIAGYIVFGVSTSAFLALHSAHTLRVLPDSRRRGRDLGLFNLTNTIPSLTVPALTLALVPSLGFAALFLALAVLAGLAVGLLAGMREAA